MDSYTLLAWRRLRGDREKKFKEGEPGIIYRVFGDPPPPTLLPCVCWLRVARHYNAYLQRAPSILPRHK